MRSRFRTETVRPNWYRMTQAQKALYQARPWWIAWGRADRAGYYLGSVFHPWRSPQESQDWWAWRPGGNRQRTLQSLLTRWGERPEWLLCITQPFYEFARRDIGWMHWDDVGWNPGGALLRWVQQWPVDHGQFVVPPSALRIPGIADAAPWMSLVPVGEPIALSTWYAQGLDQGLTVPASTSWALLVLSQCLMLQALGGGYFDRAETAAPRWADAYDGFQPVASQEPMS